MKISLYEMFCTDTLRHRETARKIIKEIAKEPESYPVIIDFDKIDFASRSFLHELICDLCDRNVVFENRSIDVLKMMDVISRSEESQEVAPSIAP